MELVSFWKYFLPIWAGVALAVVVVDKNIIRTKQCLECDGQICRLVSYNEKVPCPQPWKKLEKIRTRYLCSLWSSRNGKRAEADEFRRGCWIVAQFYRDIGGWGQDNLGFAITLFETAARVKEEIRHATQGEVAWIVRRMLKDYCIVPRVNDIGTLYHFEKPQEPILIPVVNYVRLALIVAAFAAVLYTAVIGGLAIYGKLT